YYRDMAVCLTVGLTPYDVFLGVFGKRDDPSSGGRQMPAHWSARRLNIVTGSSPIATQIPHAAGVAYAVKYRGEDAVVASWFGDGATSEGDWHEGLTLLECMTYLFHPHTSDDDDRTYRSREEVEEARSKDPILLLGNDLKGLGLMDDERIEALRTEQKALVDQEVDRAWNAPDPDPESALLHVFGEAGDNAMPSHGTEAVPAEPPPPEDA